MSALFISDMHLGSPMCKAEALCQILARNRHHYSIWVIGDGFDDVTYRNLPSLHLEALELILSFGEVVWLPGNHDHGLRKLWGLSGRIKVADEAIYTANNGKRYLVTHGDRYDWTLYLTPPRWLRRILFRKSATGFHGRIMSKMQKRYAMRDVRDLVLDGIICGHSHTPEISSVDGLEYVNCGDWVQHCTAVIDDSFGLRLEGAQ